MERHLNRLKEMPTKFLGTKREKGWVGGEELCATGRNERARIDGVKAWGWIHMVQNEFECRACVNTATNIRLAQNA